MNLYHFSNKELDTLRPMICNNRHNGEDLNVVNKPTIYLSNDPNEIFSTTDGVYRYKYTVEVAQNDPNLF